MRTSDAHKLNIRLSVADSSAISQHKRSQTTDLAESLVESLRNNDPQALEALYYAYATPLSRFAARFLGSREAAMDAIHDVYVSIWERRHTIEVRTTFKAYLYSAVRRRASDILRHRKVVENNELLADLTAPPGQSQPDLLPDEQYVHNELSASLRQAINSLPNRTREVTRLRWEDGLGRTEIAEALEISVKTVDNLLVVAMKALRKALKNK